MAELLVAVIVLAVLAIIPACIAEGKGRNFFAWHVYGFWLWIVAVIHAATLRPNATALRNQGLAPCPYCHDWMSTGAVVCPHCRSQHPEAQQRIDAAQQVEAAREEKARADAIWREKQQPIRAAIVYLFLVALIFASVYLYVAHRH